MRSTVFCFTSLLLAPLLVTMLAGCAGRTVRLVPGNIAPSALLPAAQACTAPGPVHFCEILKVSCRKTAIECIQLIRPFFVMYLPFFADLKRGYRFDRWQVFYPR